MNRDELILEYRRSSGFKRAARIIVPDPDDPSMFFAVRRLSAPEWERIEQLREQEPVKDATETQVAAFLREQAKAANKIALQAVLFSEPDALLDELPAFTGKLVNEIVKFSGWSDPLVQKAP